MQEREGSNQTSVTIATLLRLAADGELTSEQSARLEAHLAGSPEDQARVEFDRQLREGCRIACSTDVHAPAALRDRIVAACCTEISTGIPTGSDQGALDEALANRADQTRDQSFWASRGMGMVARFGAVAALIALVGVVSFMVGRTGPTTSGNNQAGLVNPPVVIDRIANFVRQEHTKCADGVPSASGKFTIQDPSELPDAFEALVGKPLDFGAMLASGEQGLRFRDAGVCYPPGGDAYHLRFEFVDDERTGDVSLWIQADPGDPALDEGVTYTKGDGCQCVRLWVADGVRYMLICSESVDPTRATEAMRCPGKTQEI